jgi:hypothetical protein
MESTDTSTTQQQSDALAEPIAAVLQNARGSVLNGANGPWNIKG